MAYSCALLRSSSCTTYLCSQKIVRQPKKFEKIEKTLKIFKILKKQQHLIGYVIRHIIIFCCLRVSEALATNQSGNFRQRIKDK